MIKPWEECLYNASQASRKVTHFFSRWMTQREINRCDDELAFAKDINTITAHRNFLKRTLTLVQIRRWAFPLWLPWFLYKGVERLFAKPLADEIKFAPKHW